MSRKGLEKELGKLVKEGTKIVEEIGPKIVVSEPLSDNDFGRMRRHLDKEIAWLLKAKKEILGG